MLFESFVHLFNKFNCPNQYYFSFVNFKMETPEHQYSPCVGSGLCCKTGPCGFGLWNVQKHQCEYLEVSYAEKESSVEIFKCGRYDYIKDQPGAEFMPAFGAGCCMSLFNRDRSNIIAAYKAGNKKVIEILKR